jgi:DNA-binding NarL/FixJ family response regulator
VQRDLKGAPRMPSTPSDLPILLPVVRRSDSELAMSSSLISSVVGQPTGNAPSPTEALSGKEICLGVIDEYPFTLECISSHIKVLSENLRVLSFSSIEDCINFGVQNFDLVLYHIHVSALGQQGPDDTIALLKPTFRSFPVIILSDLDTTGSMLAALESGARGYIPTASTSVAVAVEAIRLVRAGGIFVPASSLRMMNHPPLPSELTLKEPLTSRQMAVLHQLTQGKSNKVIAYELEMSESTVKVHVRSIMKKMRATNRTEVAFRAQNLWSAERQRLIVAPQARGHNEAA